MDIPEIPLWEFPKKFQNKTEEVVEGIREIKLLMSI